MSSCSYTHSLHHLGHPGGLITETCPSCQERLVIGKVGYLEKKEKFFFLMLINMLENIHVSMTQLSGVIGAECESG